MDGIQLSPVLAASVAGLSALMFVLGVALVPVLVARMRADYFVQVEAPGGGRTGGSGTIRFTLVVVRNVLGAVLLLVGLGLLVLPGQGILTILVGLSLMTFPGKRRLELAMARQPAVLGAIQWIRGRAGRPPLLMPTDRESP